jgi:hypothetical protein
MRSIKSVLVIIGVALVLMHPAALAQDQDWHDKGRRLLSQQKYDEAIKAFSTAIDIIPLDYRSYKNKQAAANLSTRLKQDGFSPRIVLK